MRNSFAVIASACFLGLATPANAHIQPELSIGSSGAGFGLSSHFTSHSDLRLSADLFDAGGYPLTTTTSDTLAPTGQTPVTANFVFDDSFRARSVSIIFDRYLGHTPFYLSGGLAYDNMRLTAISRPNQSSVLINGSTVSGTYFGPITINVRWNPIVPYFGLGMQKTDSYGDEHGPRIEVGAFVQGPRRISTATSGVIQNNPATFGSYVQAFNNDLPSHIPVLALYPIVRLSFPLGYSDHHHGDSRTPAALTSVPTTTAAVPPAGAAASSGSRRVIPAP